MKHKLVLVGYISCYTAYLDISREDAVKRYEAENSKNSSKAEEVWEFEFEDSFECYAASKDWASRYW